MTELEADLQSGILKSLRSWGWAYLKTTPGINGVPKGWPDITVFVPGGESIFLELKRPGENPTPIQVDRAKRLRRAGYLVFNIDNHGHAVRVLRQAWERSHSWERPL